MADSIEYLLSESGGVLLRQELAAVGLDADRLYRAIRAGTWRAEGRRVVVHSTAPTGLVTDALVAARPTSGSIITGAAAALLRPNPVWSNDTFATERPLLIAPRTRSRSYRTVRHPGAVSVEVARCAVADDHTTLIDLLRYLPLERAKAIAGDANRLELTTHESLKASVEALRGTSGSGQLRRLVKAMLDGAESGPEIDLHEALHEARITGWVANKTFQLGADTLRPDIVFDRERVAVEYDGVAPHSTVSAFHGDRARIRSLQFWQWVVLPITHRTLYDGGGCREFLEDLVELLAYRRQAVANAAKFRGRRAS